MCRRTCQVTTDSSEVEWRNGSPKSLQNDTKTVHVETVEKTQHNREGLFGQSHFKSSVANRIDTLVRIDALPLQHVLNQSKHASSNY